MAAGLALSSCQNAKLDPLSGDYLPAPTVVKLTKLDKSEAGKDAAGRWVFKLDLSEASNKLHLELVGNNYYLASNTYTGATAEAAASGNFITPATTLNGKTVSGAVTVKQNESDYSISAVLFEGSNPYKLEWEGQLVYEKAPIPAAAYVFSIAKPADVTDANSATVAGVKSNVVTLNDFNGNFAAQFNLILTEGKTDITGKYTVKEYAAEDHAAGNGFDLGVLFGMGAGEYVIGSYYMKDGTAVIIEPGETFEIYVEDGSYVFEGSTGYVFVAKAEEVDPTLWGTVNLGEGVTLLGADRDVDAKTVTVQFATAGLEKPFTKNSSGYYLNLVLYSKDGYLHEGSFAASDVLAEGTFLKGHDVYEPGVVMNEGTTLWKVTGNTAEVRNITDGTVTVARNEPEVEGGEVTWTFSLQTDQVVLSFTGAIADLTSEGVLISDVDPSLLTKVLSASSNVGSGVPTLSLRFGTDDLAYANYQTTGTGYALSMDIYSPDGKLYEGVYTACAEGGNVGPGEFGIGYDTVFWGMDMFNWGTCWWVYDKKAETYEVAQKVLDGTVAVSYDPATQEFSISLESSVVNTTFVGAIPGVEGVVEVDDYDGIKVDKLVSLANNSGTLSLEFRSEGIEQSGTDEFYSPLYSGTGYALKMDIVSTDGVLTAGVYTASAVGGAAGAGEFSIGYDTQFWGMDMHNWGTVLFAVNNGETVPTKVTEGTVTVSKRGDVYTILLESAQVPTVRFKGKLQAQ